MKLILTAGVCNVCLTGWGFTIAESMQVFKKCPTWLQSIANAHEVEFDGK